jgi:hypothetical protein
VPHSSIEAGEQALPDAVERRGAALWVQRRNHAEGIEPPSVLPRGNGSCEVQRHNVTSRMPLTGTSGSVGGLGGRPPRPTRPRKSLTPARPDHRRRTRSESESNGMKCYMIRFSVSGSRVASLPQRPVGCGLPAVTAPVVSPETSLPVHAPARACSILEVEQFWPILGTIQVLRRSHHMLVTGVVRPHDSGLLTQALM